jgi:putative transposase
MPRRPRIAPGGFPQHVLNRSAGRIKLFHREKDFLAFEKLLIEAHQRFPIRILAWCLMGNHWHLVVYPEKEGQVTSFFRWLTHTHAMRWRTSHRTIGLGPLYQGRFKSFLIERDGHLRTVCRYVERNALTAGLVERAEEWRWSSLYVREHGSPELRAILADWPIPRPRDWVRQVNLALTAKEKEAMQTSIRRSRPFGSETWLKQTVAEQHLEHTLRREGRPSREKPSPKSR